MPAVNHTIRLLRVRRSRSITTIFSLEGRRRAVIKLAIGSWQRWTSAWDLLTHWNYANPDASCRMPGCRAVTLFGNLLPTLKKLLALAGNDEWRPTALILLANYCKLPIADCQLIKQFDITQLRLHCTTSDAENKPIYYPLLSSARD